MSLYIYMYMCVCVCVCVCDLIYFYVDVVLLFKLSRVQPCCDLTDCSPLGFSVHGISQARITEWAAISFFGGSS